MYTSVLNISFHKDRTIPISDLCKLVLGTIPDKHNYYLDGLELKNNQNTDVSLYYEITHELLSIQTGSIVVPEVFRSLELTPRSQEVGLGLSTYTMLYFRANSPKALWDEPYDLQLHVIVKARKN
jgi:hypothetical protein